ncbi:replication endonuclease [Serratia microhaemolytica]|uniref:replication endonuclease n=1 Tax=Serratia microhaemolytica TaxID=2675110 RepID=UPI000FDEBC92|nr:replication endonuclease [Serratia microhaemolytica]
MSSETSTARPQQGATRQPGQYRYHWNLPRPAIGRALNQPARGFSYLTPEGRRKRIQLAELLQQPEPFAHTQRLRRRLAALPHAIRRYYARQLEQRQAHSQQAAERWLVNSFERYVLSRIDAINQHYLPTGITPPALLPIRDQLQRLLWAGKRELKRLAYTLADLLTGEFMREFDHQLPHNGAQFATLSGYGRIASLAQHLNMAIPGWQAYCQQKLNADEALRAVSRLQSAKWWLNRLRRTHARWREHLMIATGYVQKKADPYSSAPCLQEWLAQKRANLAYLKAMDLEDQQTGERLSLIDKVSGSVANPANRRRELMTRMRGFEALAQQQGLAGDFYTLTAPSRYHAMQHNGRRNNKYNGASPRETQQYLCAVWAKIRASWKRAGIRVFGFRVVEPHHDATPHWHLLLFMAREQIEPAREIFRRYALEVDGDEAGAQQNRCQVVAIDSKQGSATGYIAKYISKNIDGYALEGEKDDETGEDLQQMSKRVSAWASRWAIRQFQQIGGAPVTVYRELRRLGDRELVLHPELEPARQAANQGAWDHYVSAQGGPLVARKDLRVRLNYQITPNGNDYGDDVARITGVYCPELGSDSLIFTRTTQYKIVPKRQAVGVAVDLPGGAAAAWSSVNNCTWPNHDGAMAEREKNDFCAPSHRQRQPRAPDLAAAEQVTRQSATETCVP